MGGFEEDGLDLLPEQAAEAAAAMAALRPVAEEAGRSISSSFERAGVSLARSLTRAAADGKVTLDELAEAALAVVNALARSGSSRGGGSGLADVVTSVLSSFGGARADGGPVLPGGSYLVGERGPELFRPASAGDVEPLGPGALTINVAVERGAEGGLARSEG